MLTCSGTIIVALLTVAKPSNLVPSLNVTLIKASVILDNPLRLISFPFIESPHVIDSSETKYLPSILGKFLFSSSQSEKIISAGRPTAFDGNIQFPL